MHSKLKEILNKNKQIFNISSSNSLLEAAKKMAEYKVGSLLVFDDKVLHGIITERDFLFKAYSFSQDLEKYRVSDIMTRNIISMNHEQTAQEALKLMTEKRIRHLPVYDDNNIFLGLLSIGDLTKWASSRYYKKYEEVENLMDYINQ